MKTVVVLTRAGMSAGSGIKTFRNMGGRWKQYDVTEVASPQGWDKHPEIVLGFYNQHRKQLLESNPNSGHVELAEMEKYFNVKIITQNIDDLHERAGSSDVLHLHEELSKVRSSVDASFVYNLGHWELKLGDKCEKGSQLCPHIVWFGEAVSTITEAEEIVKKTYIFVVIGRFLNVYPAVGLLWNIPEGTPVYLINPRDMNIPQHLSVTHIKKIASEGVKRLRLMLRQESEQ